MTKWKHSIVHEHVRGRTIVRCVPCGKQSGKLDTPEDALAWALQHVGVLERKERVREK